MDNHEQDRNHFLRPFKKIARLVTAKKVIVGVLATLILNVLSAPGITLAADNEGPIVFIEGRSGNDYYKYPRSCTVKAVYGYAPDTRYGMSIFCGKTGQFSRYLFQYTNSYGENIRLTRPVGIEWFQQVRILPGDSPFIQTDLVITPIS